MFVNGIHQWPVIKRFLTWSTSDHLFPWCRNVPRQSMKTSGCISIHWFTWQLLLLLLVDTTPPYILQSFMATFYMLAPEFAVQYHPIPSCSVGTFWDQSLISVIRCIFQHHWQSYMWYSDMYLLIMIRWSIMYLPVIYTCILSGSACTWYADMLYFFWAWVCPPQTVFLSDLLLWLGRLNSGEVLGFWQFSFPCTCLIYFGHHVPLLTSYIRGHLL